MKTGISSHFIVAAICLVLVSSRGHSQEPERNVIAVENVSVIDVENGIAKSHQTIVVKMGRIVFVGKPEDAPQFSIQQKIDATGKFAIPGLWDMHIHAYTLNDMQLFPINGVLGVRLMWGMPFHHQWRNQFDRGEKLGPRMLIASAIIDGPNPIWPGSIVASDKVTGVGAIEKALSSRSDFAKVYSLLPRDAYFAIAEKCKKEKLPFDGHVPRMVSPAEASDAGQRCMEHLYEIPVACSNKEIELRNIVSEFVKENDGDVRSMFKTGAPVVVQRAIESYDQEKAKTLFKRFKANETWQCPTLTVLRNVAYLTEPEVQENPNLKYLSAGMRSFVARKATGDSSKFEFERKRYQFNLKLLKLMNEMGVPILAGTDVLNPFCLPGFSLHTELELMVDAGFSPADALKTATINPAIFQAREKELGTIEKGKLADIVLLEANPLDNISNTQKISTVIFQGRVFDREKLDQMLKKLEN